MVKSTRRSSGKKKQQQQQQQQQKAQAPGWGMNMNAIIMGVVVTLAVLSIFESSQATQQQKEQRSLLQQYLIDPTSAYFDVTDDSDARSNSDGNTAREIDKPLNIVLLYADDWRHDALGVAGTLPVETPFLDWLSEKKGVRFTHNCVTTSVCWISRVTLVMGQFLSRHGGSRVLNSNWYSQFNMSFPSLLKEAGYYLAWIGKWHTVNFEQIQDVFDFSSIYYGRHFFPGDPKPIHITQRNEADAIHQIRNRPTDKPFMLTVAFFAPHSWDGEAGQFFPQEKTINTTYLNMTLEPPVNMTESFARLPKFFGEENIARQRWHARFDEPTKYDTMLKNYYRLITEVDSACQAVWNELEAQGILNETMVIFTTDNGFYHGEHGLAGKWYPHEESIRTPLIVWDPRMPPNKEGTTDDSFTLNIDLAPTILGAANVSVPDVMQGQDIAALYMNQKPKIHDEWRQEFFYEYPAIFGKRVIPGSTALVRKEIKYIEWPEWDQKQLFNLTSDPGEEKDEINNPAYANLIDELKIRHDELKEWVK